VGVLDLDKEINNKKTWLAQILSWRRRKNLVALINIGSYTFQYIEKGAASADAFICFWWNNLIE
jgi:hypothetical protein